MEIRNNAEALRAFLGVSSSSSGQAVQALTTERVGTQASLAGDRATLSHAGTEVSQSVSETGVRADRVASIQRALAAGTYDIPASVVADKVIDGMILAGIDQKA